MIVWRPILALLVFAGASAHPASAQSEAEPEWRIEHQQGAMPFELMPRRYVDYPLANAVWQLAGVAAGCQVALPAAAESAKELGYLVLDAAGYAEGEREAAWRRFVTVVSGQVGTGDADACRAALSEAEPIALNAVAKMLAAGR